MDTSRAAVERRLDAFRQRCAALALALTPQRLAVYRVLAGDDSHPSAEEIHRRIKPDLPSLSLGTVYRTLEVFETHGLVSRVHALGEQARFDANLESHHHLVCVRCRRVRDVQDPQLDRLPLPDEALGGFRVLAHRIQVLGLCPDCRDET
jgi:Fur family peroxide stress response transcriptional regulator